MALIIIDFDLTIVAAQTNNLLIKYRKENPAAHGNSAEAKELRWEYIKSFSPVGNISDWQNLFEHMHAEGHKIAIASFNRFGEEIIERYLKEVLLIPSEIIENIFIHSPRINEIPPNKNGYIELIKNHFNDANATKTTLLLDDTEKNILAAASAGYQTITATADATHLKELEKRLNAWKRAAYSPKIFSKECDASSEGSASLEFESNESASRSRSPSPTFD